MPPPPALDVVYANDEEVCMIARADFASIAPKSSAYASGTDGVIAPGDRWTLTSDAVDFQAQGVEPNMVIQLSGAALKGSGELLAVESVAPGAVTLRRIGEPAGVGQPPAPAAGLTGVVFLVTSLKNQIEDVAYLLNERFAVDPALPNRTPGDVYDQRIFRRLTVYQVLLRQYVDANRTATGDFSNKIAYYDQCFRDELATATLRWGPTGKEQSPTGRFSMRLVR